MYHNTRLNDPNFHPLDVDPALYELAMGRGQMTAQLRGGCSNYRQSISRVTKPSSASSSPQRLQRRRTSASSQRMAKYRSELYPHTFQSVHDSSIAHQSAPPTAVNSRARPMSWHPSTMASTHENRSIFQANPVASHYTNEYQVAMAGCSRPLHTTQQDLKSYIPMAPRFHQDDHDRFGRSMGHRVDDYMNDQSQGLRIDTISYNTSLVHQNEPYSTSAISQTDNYPSFSPLTGQPQAWTNTLMGEPVYTVPPTPDLFPVQRPSTLLYQEPEAPALDHGGGKELVGLGLYDNTESVSSTGALLGASPASKSWQGTLGKGLKLEETWEPPEENDESDEDDEEGDDVESEGDEESDDAEQQASNVAEAATDEHEHEHEVPFEESGVTTEAFRQLYGDMSNQSFYFDACDDDYAGMKVEQSNGRMVYDGQQPVLVGREMMW